MTHVECVMDQGPYTSVDVQIYHKVIAIVRQMFSTL